MSFIKKIIENAKADDRYRLKILLLLNLGFFLFLMLVTTFGQDGMVKVHKLDEEISEVEKEIVDMNNKNAEIKDKILSMKIDYSLIERIAREKLGLVKSGETVYEFVRR